MPVVTPSQAQAIQLRGEGDTPVIVIDATTGTGGLGEGAELASSQLGRGYYVTGGAWRPSGGMWRLIFKA